VKLKNKLVKALVLAIYDPKASTELHYDASTHGFGEILVQKAKKNNKMHNINLIFYFSHKIAKIKA